jgi:hypothetical protein
MSVYTPAIPKAFDQEEIASYFDDVADKADAAGHEVLAFSARQHAANARNTAEYLRAPCFTCATGGE